MDCHGNVEISGVREPRGNIRLLFGLVQKIYTLGNAYRGYSLSVLNANLALRLLLSSFL